MTLYYFYQMLQQEMEKMKADILTPPSTYYGVTEYVNERPDPTVPPPESIASITVPKKL